LNCLDEHIYFYRKIVTIKPITPLEFTKIKNLLKEYCGVALGDDQAYLVETRLAELSKEIGIKTFSELYDRISADSEHLLLEVTHLLTTHETSWFRDSSFWNILEKSILPKMFEELNTHKRIIKIWSAGCSTGQEPYSLAILIDEMCRQRGLLNEVNRFYILGMDISKFAISTATTGLYNTFDTKRGLSEQRRSFYFKPIGHKWQLREDIRQRVKFRQINLMNNFAHLGSFDMVLCRNVIVYFSPEFRKMMISKIVDVLAKEGLLFLGASESLYGYYPDKLKKIEFERGVYMKRL
jgi:chemotaxis protein methyltransferase CheR